MIAWNSYNPARKDNPPGYLDYETKVIPRFKAIAAQTGKPWGLSWHPRHSVQLVEPAIRHVTQARRVRASSAHSSSRRKTPA